MTTLQEDIINNCNIIKHDDVRTIEKRVCFRSQGSKVFFNNAI
jgi:hypothetical protein